MKSIDGRNNVKIYDLTAGKSFPDWLSNRQKRKLYKKDVDLKSRIELIQDFKMPDLCSNIQVTLDGEYIFAAGCYKPKITCYETSLLSMKFERGIDEVITKFEILSEDYSKMLLLEGSRTLEFHYQGGRWFKTVLPRVCRDFSYHYPSCEIYFTSGGKEIYRLNLQEGRYLTPLECESMGTYCCTFNPVHYLFVCGTKDGRVEAWDPRAPSKVGSLDCALHMMKQSFDVSQFKSASEFGVTSVNFKDDLVLGVGTQTGQVLLYDMRSDKPLLIKDHMDGRPIKKVQFHEKSGKALSLSRSILKIWDANTGEPHTSIDADNDFNDLCMNGNSGLIFIAADQPKIITHFLPSLGGAPKWCPHLDSLIEELEDYDVGTSTYDDYKFITHDELVQLGLDNLVGSNMLRAVMHGYFMDVRLYNRASSASSHFDKEKIVKEKVAKKIAEENLRKSAVKNDSAQKEIGEEEADDKLEEMPEVNLWAHSVLKKHRKGERAMAHASNKLLKDDRFKPMFNNTDFKLDKENVLFKMLQPVGYSRGENMDFSDSAPSDDEEAEKKKKPLPPKELYPTKMFEEEKNPSDLDAPLNSEDSDDPDNAEEQRKKMKEQRRNRPNFFENPNGQKGDEATEKRPRELQFMAANNMNELTYNYMKDMKKALQKRMKSETQETAESEHVIKFNHRQTAAAEEEAAKKVPSKGQQAKADHIDFRRKASRKTFVKRDVNQRR